MEELGWDEAAEGALVLVEWPDRAGASSARLTGSISPLLSTPTQGAELPHRDSDRLRHASQCGSTSPAPFINVLAESGFDDAERQFMQGDASTRAYERLVRAGRHAPPF